MPPLTPASAYVCVPLTEELPYRHPPGWVIVPAVAGVPSPQLIVT